MKEILSVKNLSFSYSNAKNSNKKTLEDISFSLEEGSYTVLAGLNGSGKSTLARIIAGLQSFSEGTVKITENKKIGIVFQSPKDQIIASIVSNDTAFGPEYSGATKPQIELITIESLMSTGMLHLASTKTTEISLGQTQKLALTGILALNPDILLLDESLSMVEFESRLELLNLFDILNSKGKTILHITHNKECLMRAKNVIYMQEGKIFWQGLRSDFEKQPSFFYLFPNLPKKEIFQKEDFINDSKKITFSAEHIDFSYKNARKQEKILSDVSFCLYEGSLIALMGKSGAGKSTLLELGAGLLRQDSGVLKAKKHASLCLQNSDAALFEQIACDDVAFGPKNQGLEGKELKLAVKKSMEQAALPFSEFANRRTLALSGGEKKRLSIAGILALDSDVIFFDEPTAGLDGKSRIAMMELLRTLGKNGKTVLFTTHRKDESEAADRTFILDDGNLFDSWNVSLGSVTLPELKALDSLPILERLQNFSFFTERPFKTIISKLPPVVRFLIFILLFTAVIAVPGTFLPLGMFCISILYAFFAKVPFKKLFSTMIKLAFLLIFFCSLSVDFCSCFAGRRNFV